MIIDILPDLYISGKRVGQGFLLPLRDVVLGSGGEDWDLDSEHRTSFALSSNETQPSAS